ncbi:MULTISPECIES: hypothetical protein [Rhodococcus]|uniref:hypothetical protein n=1 Tax=Rhodococcus TaxID=1827 RepID=UPI000B335674|nr:hypothetical protein [Rhodococcus globerulus]
MGQTMRAGIRRNSKRAAPSPEALAALLPNELRSLKGLYTRSDFLSLRVHVVDWLSHAVPGQEHVLVSPVMGAAGLSAADFYRQALGAGQKQAGPAHYESETR